MKADEEKCITCYASNSATPHWNGTKCVSCYTANSAKPYWNGTQCTACPTATPVWSTAQNKCITCVASNSATPVWNDTKCVSCYTANSAKPYWNGTQCTACPTATPVWSTTQNKCVNCYTADATKPYWNGTQCTVCPTATPVWSTTQNKCITCAVFNSATPYWNGTQCVSCYTANSAKPYWNGTQCTTCPTATPYWNNTKQQSVKCLQNSDCSGTTPVCNTTTNVCEACQSGYGFSATQNKCVVQRTVTINNVGTKTTQIVLDGETMAKPSASYPDFTFSHWSTTKGGAAVTFPLKVTSNITLYAYYKEGTETHEGYYRVASSKSIKTLTFADPMKIRLFLKRSYNDDTPKTCSEAKTASDSSFMYTLDGKTTTGITGYCQSYNIGTAMSIP